MHVSRLRVGAGAVAAALTFGATAHADTVSSTFEPPSWSTGSPHLQQGWVSSGSAGSGCATYDHAVAATSGFPGVPALFGAQSLRISNAVTSGCFGDHTFSAPTADSAGENSADGGTLAGGTRRNVFEASWAFRSAVPGAEQPGLSVVVSPDRGDGARMSWIQMADSPGGIDVNFYAAAEDGTFAATSVPVAQDLDRAKTHTVKVVMTFLEGPNNDVVDVFVNGLPRLIGRSWEQYFREAEGNPTRPVDSLLFRTGGAAAPATAGNGFLIDRVSATAANRPLLVLRARLLNKLEAKTGRLGFLPPH